MNQNPNILTLTDLRTHFPIEKGVFIRKQIGSVKAVDGVSLTLKRGEVLGLVGESGCGKSTLGRSILQLIRPTAGDVRFEGQDLTQLEGEALRSERQQFQMIFQDPHASLNPRMTVYDTLAEAILTHRPECKKRILQEISELMERVGLSPRYIRKYPHEFSGGQRQRIAIARALAVQPRLIIADEPVSALDVSIQAQILNLLTRLCREMDLTMIFISHDLSVVKHIADRIGVMYLGKIIELGPAHDVSTNPLHPYTQALISAVPIPDPVRERQRRRIILAGDPPSPINPPHGCAFHPRCPIATSECQQAVPPLEPKRPAHDVACIHVAQTADASSST